MVVRHGQPVVYRWMFASFTDNHQIGKNVPNNQVPNGPILMAFACQSIAASLSPF